MYPDSSLRLNYETDDAVYFFSGAFDPLNNWSAHAVNVWGRTFPTAEHAFHYRKFLEAFPKIANEIIAAPSPWAAMRVDRKHIDKRRQDWDDVKIGIMTEIARAKVVQNEDVRELLLSTGSKQIIENSPWDSFWGCGADGTGQNNMGKILMTIRGELS
jgi:N-glycosidase YbiA